MCGECGECSVFGGVDCGLCWEFMWIVWGSVEFNCGECGLCWECVGSVSVFYKKNAKYFVSLLPKIFENS